MSTNQIEKNAAKQVADLIYQGVDSWLKAGEIIAREMDKNPDFIEQISDQYPDLPVNILYRFEQIGRKQVYPRLLLNDSPGARRLIKMPYALQVKYSDEPMALLTKSGDSLKVEVRNLTPDQANQAFASDHIRTLAEQRAWLEDKESFSAAVPASGNPPYRIVGKTVVVMQGCKFSVGDLARILVELEK